MIQWQNMGRSVYRSYLNICDLTESDRRERRLCVSVEDEADMSSSCVSSEHKNTKHAEKEYKSVKEKELPLYHQPPTHTFTETHTSLFFSHH